MVNTVDSTPTVRIPKSELNVQGWIGFHTAVSQSLADTMGIELRPAALLRQSTQESLIHHQREVE